MKVQPLPRSAYESHLAAAGDECVFCRPEDALTIKAYMHWNFMYAAFPYRKYHCLLVTKRHVRNFDELSSEELHELGLITNEVTSLYKKAGIVSATSVYGNQLLFSWRSRLEDSIEKKAVSHFHLHSYPEASKEIGIVLDQEAHAIDVALLKNLVG